MSATTRLHWYRINVVTKDGPYGEKVTSLFWDGLRFELRMKYDWYFTYRAALLQVQFPKYKVSCNWGNEVPVAYDIQIVRELEGRITARKRGVSKYRNKIIHARNQWNQLFPIYEHPHYQKLFDYFERQCNELLQYQIELLNHQQLDE